MRCAHGRDGLCFQCGATKARAGLDPIVGALGGFFFRYDTDPSTPVDQGRWRRYDVNGMENDNLFCPLSDVANIPNPTHYREASPTGKIGGGEMFARLPSQNFTGENVNGTALLAPRPTPKDARKVTRSQVDPWGSTLGKPSWTPGKMAQEAVSG